MQKVKEKSNWKGETIVEIEIERLKAFRNHPFQVRDDDNLEKLKESIKMYGILTPLLVRPIKDGTYEIISGHRRKRAAALLGYRKIPVLIQPMSYEDAVVKMVDTNLHREHISFSEKAFAYRMKNEAMKHQGARTDLTSGQNVPKFKRTTEIIAHGTGESSKQVQRYIRLTELIPDLLELVDKKKLPFTVAVEISYIDEKIQQWLYEYIRDNGFIKPKQISALREHLKIEKINQQQLITLLNENMPGRKSVRKVTLSEDRLSKYFPPFYSQDDMEKVLIQLLEIWKQNQTQDDE